MKKWSLILVACAAFSASAGGVKSSRGCGFGLLAWASYLIDSSKIPLLTLDEGDLDKFYFTADPHFAHDRIIELANRPFTSAAEMEWKLVQSWNEKVPPDGVVFIVGDLAMNLDVARRILPRLNGMKILVAGNHDLCHPVNQKCRTAEDYERFRLEYLLAGFDEVELAARVQMPGVEPFIVNHYPYLTETHFDPERLAPVPFLVADDGQSFLLTGHVHDDWKTRERMINVGLDVWDFAPVSARTLRDLATGQSSPK